MLNNFADLSSVSPTFTAIQCKFYSKDAKVPKSGIDSFISASDKKFFTARYIVATNQDWTDNVRKDLANKSVPVRIITRTELEDSSIDWSIYLNTPGKIESLKRELRPYQVEAVNNVISGFRTFNRGKLIMACGTGKTFTSLKIAERQVGPHGFVLFLVPSLSLLSQTLSDWKRYSAYPMAAFAVCSDDKVGKARTSKEDIQDLISESELTYPATTDPQKLARAVDNVQHLTNNQGLGFDTDVASASAEQPNGMTVIFSTYHSIDVIAAAQHQYGMPEFDLVICDEAHRTTGCYGQIKVNVDVNLPVATICEEATPGESFVAQAPAETKEPEAKDSKPKKKRAKSRVGIVSEEASAFTYIHNDQYLHAKKRLYMTATPRIFVDKEGKGDTSELDVYSMDDESIYGPTFHVLNFSTAVSLGCLVDYKVLILAVERSLLPVFDERLDLSQKNCAKIVGTWKALNKFGVLQDLEDDPEPMHRAVGFAQIIDSKDRDKIASKKFTAHFQSVIEQYIKHFEETFAQGSTGVTQDAQTDLSYEQKQIEYQYLQEHPLYCSCKHIDGHMDAVQKSSLLDWLKAPAAADESKILFNVRCLSEGIDVPALDAVVFFSPRSNQVEVVQTVGRVMRKAPGKKRGYVIVPLVTDDMEHPEKVFNVNSDYKVVWQILNALKAINPERDMFDARLNKIDPHIQIVCISDKVVHKSSGSSGKKPKPDKTDPGSLGSLLMSEWDTLKIEENIKSVIIKKLGNRRSWEMWAHDVAQICQTQVQAIEQHLQTHPESQEAFTDFRAKLSSTLRMNLAEQELIEMLSQHIVVKPVLDELFRGYPFTEKNPIAHALTNILQLLDHEGLSKTNLQLKEFYDSVALRMNNVETLAERQIVIVELFDNFFKKAFPKQQEKLGIVYTPVEVVDFINHSVNDLLQREFGQSLTDRNVHILDPFTGTGTFLARMMLDESLIKPEDLTRKYQEELHAFEIMPLAYYVASINMEAVYAERTHQKPENYTHNNIVVLTDTFADKADFNFKSDVLTLNADLDQNQELREQVEGLPLRVIVGNPPYSVGQKSQNDDNKNSVYPMLDSRIASTYAEQADKVSNKSKVYDSYIRAFRWASDKLGNKGIIAFVSNAGWLDSTSACGMRRCLQAEFSSIYIYHLKGNARSSGEQRRKEGDNIFSNGSRAPIAITILVKNTDATEHGKIYFATVDDYMDREAKLSQLKDMRSIINAPLIEITPDEHGDWLNQRRSDFVKFIPMDGKKQAGLAIFRNLSLGINTGRDAWSYNASQGTITQNFENCIAFYNSQVEEAIRLGDKFDRNNDPTKIKWDRPQIAHVTKGKFYQPFNKDSVVRSLYRPFFKEWLYNESSWICCTYQMPKLFPYGGAKNLVIVVSGLAAKDFMPLMSDMICDLHVLDSVSQCFPRYLYRKAENGAGSEAKTSKLEDVDSAVGFLAAIEAGSDQDQAQIDTSAAVDEHGYVREDAINPEAVAHFRQAYPEDAAKIDADSVFYYIYGVMHSPEYRSTYANNLQKELPRIPRVATYDEFSAFEQAGRDLAQLHVNYERVTPYTGCTIEYDSSFTGHQSNKYRVKQLKYGKIEGKKGNAAKDKSVIFYNDYITIRDIPLEAQEYVVNKKSALDWIVERCCISQDKDSQIINDYNEYARELGDDKYIFNLILRVITVSLETMKIVKALPKLNIHPLDK